MSLSDLKIKSSKPAEKPYKLSDRDGLYLLVSPSGSKSWKLKFRLHGKEQKLSFGKYPSVSLQAARDKTREARKVLEEGADPRNTSKRPPSNAYRYNDLLDDWIKKKCATEWSELRKNNVTKRLDKHVRPVIGDIPADLVTTDDCLKVVKAIEDAGHYNMSNEVRRYMSHAFLFGVAAKRVKHDPAGAVAPLCAKKPPAINNPHLENKEIPPFYRKLMAVKDDISPIVHIATDILLHTFPRTQELRFAKWPNADFWSLDFDRKLWKVPIGDVKTRVTHMIPLTDYVISRFKEIEKYTGHGEYIFPSPYNPSAPMTEGAIRQLIKRLGYKGRLTGHGFRGTASTFLNESGKFNYLAIEVQLAHKIKSDYNHAAYLDERREMMEYWSSYLLSSLSIHN